MEYLFGGVICQWYKQNKTAHNVQGIKLMRTVLLTIMIVAATSVPAAALNILVPGYTAEFNYRRCLDAARAAGTDSDGA